VKRLFCSSIINFSNVSNVGR